MATYVNNLRLKEITTGDEDGTWGTSTNTNLELVTDGFSYGTKQMAADANETFTMPDATTDATRGFYLKITSAASLTATREVTLGPNTVSKVWMIENATTGSQIITIKQGSGATVNVANGSKVMIATDGLGAGAAVIDANSSVGTAATITVASESTDTTCFPAFFTAATGDLGPKSNAGLTYNSATNTFGVGILTVGNRQTLSTGADIASATTVDLTAATGNTVVITGTTTTTAFTMNAGQQMILLPSGALPLTYNATTMNINGGVSYTCAAGDRLYATKDLAGVIRVSVMKQDGTSVVAAASDATQALTDAATVNWDMASGNIGLWAIGANRILAAPTNLVVGSSALRITQDATGSRTVTWNAIFKWSAGAAPVLSTAGNAVDIVSFIYDGTYLYGSLVSRGAA